MKYITALLLTFTLGASIDCAPARTQSQYPQIESEQLRSVQSARGDIIPDFSRVGYHFGDLPIPHVKEVVRLSPPKNGEDASALIQGAIDSLAALPLEGRGAILLQRGQYNIGRPLTIKHSGIVLRGEGAEPQTDKATILIATDTTRKWSLITIGTDSKIRGKATEMNIVDEYIPLGQFWVSVSNPEEFSVGDKVIVMTNHNQRWIEELQMDNIKPSKKAGHQTVQWSTTRFNMKARREITKIEGARIWLENPIVEGIDKRWGGGALYKYYYSDGIVSECGVEQLFVESLYSHPTDEKHGWNAIRFMTSEHCWVRNINGKHFGYALVAITKLGKNITVEGCKHSQSISKPQGGRRYTFSISGELNLVKDCIAEDGRHSFVSSPTNSGPNVFTSCKAVRALTDIGPHHRWNVATLYDNIKSDGPINAHDRGNSGTGHGWAGANNVFWNCEASTSCINSPWGDIARNYSFGHVGEKMRNPRSSYPQNRPDGVWISHGEHIAPLSLYEAQLELRHRIHKSVYDVE